MMPQLMILDQPLPIRRFRDDDFMEYNTEAYGDYGEDLLNLDDPLPIKKFSDDWEYTINAYDPYGTMMLVNLQQEEDLLNLDDDEDDLPICKYAIYYGRAPTNCKCPDGSYFVEKMSNGAYGPHMTSTCTAKTDDDLMMLLI